MYIFAVKFKPFAERFVLSKVFDDAQQQVIQQVLIIDFILPHRHIENIAKYFKILNLFNKSVPTEFTEVSTEFTEVFK
jgi:hypothetical protein